MHTRRYLCTLLVLVIAFALQGGTVARGRALQGCGPGVSAVVCENLRPGDPATDWDIQGAGDPSIQGFATAISVNRGATVRFKIRTTASSYRLDVYRLGYYNGMGARKIVTLAPTAVLPQTQPACLSDATTGLVDCGNWAESASWLVPADATSGIYFAKLVRADTGGASHIVFIVRDDAGRSDLLYQASDTTWQAYNSYGGNSLYTGAPAGRAYKVSYNRPFNNRDNTSGPLEGWLFSAEYPMIRWLEANGYDVSYSAGSDTDRQGAKLLEHKVFLSVGHDEYWSAQQRASVEAARNAGVHLAFFSGNESFWKTRWENDAAGVAYRTLVCYKETSANAKIDPDPAWTGTWRDPRFSPPADGGKPENAMTGTIFMVNGTRNDAIAVPAAEGQMRFWRNTSIASLPAGQTATLPQGTLGYEWDEDKDNGSRPTGLLRLSSTTVSLTNQYLQDYGSTYGPGTATHSLTLYRHSSGALVFGAGTVQWSWGLDATHDRAGGAADPRMQQATVNLFADMGVQGASLQAGVVPASASSDTVKPASTITFPANGAYVQSGSQITITGTASDTGGVVAGVEVSTDGGTTWHPAVGRASWSYAWTPYTPGSSSTPVNIQSRAVDDSGNVQVPTGITVTINPGAGLVAAYGFEEASGTVARDQTANANNGTIAGATWTSSGKYGSALSFNGVNNLVTVNDANVLDLTNAMTIEAWVYPTVSATWRSAILKETTGGLVYGLYAQDGGSHAAAYIKVGGNDFSAAGTAAIAANTWTYIAATYDGTTLRSFVNGVQTGSTIIGGNIVASAGALRIGGNTIWGEYFQGSIDEVRIYARVLAPSEIQADMSTPVGGSPLPDTTPPTVSISSPAPGASLQGSLSVSANAADNVGVTGVQFMVDGAPIGAEDTAAPYAVTWDTRTVADGNHTLTARARDAAGNATTSSGVTVTVTNSPDVTPPSVSITAPVAGATINGTVTVTATASDNVAVAGVQFLLDGTPLNPEDLTAPYSTTWDTTLRADGSHVLTARARDGAGNVTTSAGVSVAVSNGAAMALVAAYGFEEGTGTTVEDASGRGNIATISGATWSPAGRFGKALSFNGTTNMVTVNDVNALHLTTGMTLEAWVNPSALSGWREVILKETSTALAYSLYANNNLPQPAGTINVGGADQSAVGSAGIPLNAWTHLATTYDGASLRLYVNGAQVQSVPVTGSMLASTSPLRIGGNTIWGEYYSGLIDEVRIYNRALAASDIQADMNAAVGGPPPGDTTPPTVSVTAPIAGTTVSGTLKIKANAADASGIAWVEFRVDGTTLGAFDFSAPFETYWNTGALVNGSTHTITAVARDTAGNLATSAPVTVTVMNPTDPASVGAWSAPFNLGFVAVNMVLLDTSKVLMYPGWGNGGLGASVFDPATATMTATPLTTSNIFCSGHATLADGRILVVGGWDDLNAIIGSPHARIFNPATQQWTPVPDMAFRRWYPTATTLADGRVLVTSGATTCDTCLADVPEIYDPVTNAWTQLTTARLAVPYYPLAFLLPSGKILNTGSTDTPGPARTLDLATGTWGVVDPNAPDGSSAAMFLPGKIVQSGTASDPSFTVKPSATTTQVLDMTQPSPAWRATAPMAYPRAYDTMTILPDGTVLAVSGGTDTSGRDLTKAVLPAELWSPASELWTTMAAGAVGRLYHSTSLLMPDGRVLVAGGGDLSGATSQTTAEWYSPPYLFKGARPVITAAPAQIDYSSAFFVSTPDATGITSAVLIRTGAVTHAFDENQRYVPLVFEQATGGLTLHAPTSANVAPPGHYLLFLVNGSGVPSVATFVRLPAPYEDAQPPTAPSSLTATGGIGSIALSWTAATDNVGVTGYNVHRSTVSGFTATAGNRIAQPAGTTYTDAGLAAGTYYYLVVARDAAGNLGPPSNQASATATSDTIAPTVSVTSPAAGATVSATITITATASDDVGVAGVQFLVDGAPFGAEDTTSPYSVSWDSRSVTNGSHTLGARARDAAGNTSTSTITVTVSNVVPAGLIAAYAFDEGAGTTTADAAGKGHTGTITAATWTTGGKNGNALSFNGTNAWVTIADAADLDLTNGMTLEAWVKPSALSGWNSVVMKEGTATTMSYTLYANDGNPWPSGTVHIGTLDREVVGTAPVALGVWTHLAATYDGATLRLYVNGVQVGSRAQTGSIAVSTRALRIGGNAVWGEYFNGLIDDVRVYNRALSAAEIQTDMTTPVR
jgi:N,N-dimethylformamidase beta subunit-like protein/concanavalin A-like lectin/glucanase superfamily protein/galactose oxidase-like protein/Big-like domain-containing protein/Kelch motif protein